MRAIIKEKNMDDQRRRDPTIYTKDGLAERIREIRMIRERITDREAELIILYDATVEYGCPVDSVGKPWLPKKMRKHTLKEVMEKAEVL